MKKYISKSVTQTKNLAKKLAKDFKGGEILGLVGNLGAGKTHFTKGIVEYFGVKKVVNSPTFVLLKPYVIPSEVMGSRFKTTRSHHSPAIAGSFGMTQLIHIDCYRLDSPEELLAIGLNEFISNKKNIIVIEWAEK
ncbi:tRNA (adenosine(37)-N6)-threonylcarbamoyltransferase complex ATPase subunit type 1 TsaE, partial [Candidatus Parcubacteria bacterium]|nr:tRNA (adenosine(37)-N6)-threonylcarbamoyltransferase complex ATPase subunit type 1 TsaE [Candidatus Parcubacteria bacterium]